MSKALHLQVVAQKYILKLKKKLNGKFLLETYLKRLIIYLKYNVVVRVFELLQQIILTPLLYYNKYVISQGHATIIYCKK